MELTREIGFVTKTQDYLIHLEGLPSAHPTDIISCGSGTAIIESLDDTHVQALMLNNYISRPGETFSILEGGLRLPLGNHLFGRTVNPLGVPLDGREPLPLGSERLELEKTAPGVTDRRIISEQLETGFTVVDTLLPIGKGQRELIMGEARSGKSDFILDVITHQKGRDMICVYAALGKSETDIKRSARTLSEAGADTYTIIIGASSSEPAPLIAIAPEVAINLAEHFQRRGRNVLVVLDDLGLHAKYLREIALKSEQIPGRESYPGDIFFRHSRLMERSGKFKTESGGTSTITLLPVIETEMENFTALIPTNLMSQTDGHLLFSASLNSQGHYPSIEWDRSVTRIGRQVQKPIQKFVGGKIRSLLAQYQDLKNLSKFETELSPQTQDLLKKSEMVMEILKQAPGEFVETQTQIALLAVVFSAFFDDKSLGYLKERKKRLIQALSDKKTAFSFPPEELTDFESLVEFLNGKTKEIEEMLS